MVEQRVTLTFVFFSRVQGRNPALAATLPSVIQILYITHSAVSESRYSFSDMRLGTTWATPERGDLCCQTNLKSVSASIL